MLKKARRRRDESGAIAIVYAMLVFVLMAIAALGVDIGNAVSRRTVTQTQADFAALAGGAQISDNLVAGSTPSAAIVNAVVASMNGNQPQDDAASQACWTSKTCVTAGQMTDANLANGDIRYTADGLQVTAPEHYVDYGFGKALGFSGGNVRAAATVHVYSPGLRVMPMFAVQGCDYGLQTLADPSGGGATTVVPVLAFDTENNGTEIAVPAGPEDVHGCRGEHLRAQLHRQHDRHHRQEVGPELLRRLLPQRRPDSPRDRHRRRAGRAVRHRDRLVVDQDDHRPDSRSPRSRRSGGSASTTATATRRQPRTGGPAAATCGRCAAEALPVVVGTAALQCLSGPTVGNFGTVKFPRTDVPPPASCPVDIAAGLQPPLTPHTLSPVPAHRQVRRHHHQRDHLRRAEPGPQGRTPTASTRTRAWRPMWRRRA